MGTVSLLHKSDKRLDLQTARDIYARHGRLTARTGYRAESEPCGWGPRLPRRKGLMDTSTAGTNDLYPDEIQQL